MVNQLAAAAGMGVYVMLVLYATKVPYTMMVNRGMEHIRAVYYNRKIVHMMAGGVGSLSVPFLFTDVWYPMVAGILLTLVGQRRCRRREHQAEHGHRQAQRPAHDPPHAGGGSILVVHARLHAPPPAPWPGTGPLACADRSWSTRPLVHYSPGT